MLGEIVSEGGSMTKRVRKKLSPMAEEINSQIDAMDAEWKASIPAMIEKAKNGDVGAARRVLSESLMEFLKDSGEFLPPKSPLKSYLFDCLWKIIHDETVDANRALNLVSRPVKPKRMERDFNIAVDYWLTRFYDVQFDAVRFKEISSRTEVAERWKVKPGTVLRIKHKVGERAESEARRLLEIAMDDESRLAVELAKANNERSTCKQRVKFFSILFASRPEN